MSIYTDKRKEFLLENGFHSTPVVNLFYDECKRDGDDDEKIIEKLKRRFKNAR